MSGRLINIGQLVDEKKIGAFHIYVVGMCFLLLWIDGFDITNAAFAAPLLIKEFHVSPTTLGMLFSAGLVAGLIGTPLFGLFADRFGRRKVIICGALFFGLFTLAPIFAESFQQVIVLRFIASIGVAGVLPSTVALASEFAPRRFRATMVIIMFTGSSIGGVTVGLVAAQFVPDFGWRILFWIGGIGPILLAIVLIFTLPESIRYLTTHERHRDDLVKITRRLEPGIVIDSETTFTGGHYETQPNAKLSGLFAGRLAILTPLFWFANMLSLVVLYFGASWLPTILATSAVGASHAAVVTTLFILSGTIGGLAIMRPLDRFGFLPIPIIFFIGAPALMAVGIMGLSVPVLLAMIILAGFCIYGAQFGLIAMEGPLYPPALRGRGLGLCFAAARTGAGIGPMLAGILLGHHVDTQTLYGVFAGVLLLGGITTAVITPLYRKHLEEVTHRVSLMQQSDVAATAAGIPGKTARA